MPAGPYIVHKVGPQVRFFTTLPMFEKALSRAREERHHGVLAGQYESDADLAEAVLDGQAMYLANVEARGES